MELKQFGVGESLAEKLAGLDLRDEVLEFRTTEQKFEQDLTRNDRRKCESRIATLTGCSRLVLSHESRPTSVSSEQHYIRVV